MENQAFYTWYFWYFPPSFVFRRVANLNRTKNNPMNRLLCSLLYIHSKKCETSIQTCCILADISDSLIVSSMYFRWIWSLLCSISVTHANDVFIKSIKIKTYFRSRDRWAVLLIKYRLIAGTVITKCDYI